MRLISWRGKVHRVTERDGKSWLACRPDLAAVGVVYDGLVMDLTCLGCKRRARVAFWDMHIVGNWR